MLDKLQALERELVDVESRLADPAVIADQTRYRDLAKRYKELDTIVSRARELRTRTADTNLRPLETLVISPSKRLDDIAARHLGDLPAPVRGLLRGVGVGGSGAQARGSALATRDRAATRRGTPPRRSRVVDGRSRAHTTRRPGSDGRRPARRPRTPAPRTRVSHRR